MEFSDAVTCHGSHMSGEGGGFEEKAAVLDEIDIDGHLLEGVRDAPTARRCVPPEELAQIQVSRVKHLVVVVLGHDRRAEPRQLVKQIHQRDLRRGNARRRRYSLEINIHLSKHRIRISQLITFLSKDSLISLLHKLKNL